MTRAMDLLSRRAALALFAIACPAVTLAQTTVAPPTGEGIVIYNAQHKSLGEAWAAGFTRETGIKVTLRNGGDTELSNQILLEGKASPADVFLTENSPGIAQVDNAGLLAALDVDTLAQVPANYRPANGRWIGIAARSTVFAYNTTKLSADKLPRSVMDLADPSWKGRWAASPSGADFQAIVSAMLALKGEAATADWLKGMKANVVPYKGNSVAMKAVNAGQADGALIYHYYYFGDRAKTGENSNNIALHYFRNEDPGAFVSLSGGGVMASSKHQADAKTFMKWVTSKAGQEILKSAAHEYAVASGVASSPDLVPLAELQAPKVEPSILNSRRVTDLMTAAELF